MTNRSNAAIKCLALGAAGFLIACGSQENKRTYSGVDRKNLDTTVSPAVDFYQFANGGWLKNNPIPETESRWGSFNELQENNFTALRKVLEEAAADTKAAKGSNTQKVGDFYTSGMDSASIEKAGASALAAEFEKISSIKSPSDVMNVVATFQTYGFAPLFTFYAFQDPRNSSAVVPQLYQGGLGLPDRDYYLDKSYEEIRKEYVSHMGKMFQLLGNSEAQAAAKAKSVMALETSLAKSSMTRVEQRDPVATYHKMTLPELNALTPDINWESVMSTMGITKADYLVVGQPEFLKEAGRQVKSAGLDTWKAYLEWHLIGSVAGRLSSDFVNENFRFYGTVLNGTKSLKPRWKRVLQDVDGSLGEALGQVYVEKNFSPEAKKRCLEMVNNMQEVFRERITKLDWMEQGTKDKAVAKLNSFMKKIGYPDKWKDYSKLEIDRGPYVRNVIRANQFAFSYMVNKIGKPVDKAEWLMTPPTVNAYYEPSLNEIVFPAGILQPPFFDANADDAVNYGGIGAVIGHEMTHGFDDQGRQYDAEGNLKDWWTPADAEKFVKKADVVVKQFDAYVPLDSLHVNGKLTLGENLADLGGLSIAYEAFKRTEQGKSTEKIAGFTPDQRFFLGWAQGWRNNIRDQALKQRLITDVHSPGKFRTNGPLSNMPEFYAAFGVKPGDPMHRPDSLRAKVW
jgi:putative endopeptidase